ncbi:MAG: sugar phosphate nucleotidyltransferase [Candidatus Roizmanbacteria bacterium]|nr:sugar phosphate nucleotidyltransferase [Candidatus Roizmanbacteria bacterium]
MKAVIFAGGAGTRLWPLSRKKSPKQFERIIGDKSTLQLAVERLRPEFEFKDIYISTNSAYKTIIQKQLPDIPDDNYFLEPEKKAVGPAIALVMGILQKKHPHEPLAILYSLVFLAHKPRFASENLGYIHMGKKTHENDLISFYSYEGCKYRPDEKTAEEYFASGKYAWNLGYFVTTPSFIWKAYERFTPNLFSEVKKIVDAYDTKEYPSVLKNVYSSLEKINFDNAILEKLDKETACVIVEDIGWSDIGAWEAVKEAMEQYPYENIIRGRVYLEHVRDTLIYNYEDKKLIVGIDLDEHIIVNTKDVLLIAKKSSVGKIKTLVENFEGTEHEDLT